MAFRARKLSGTFEERAPGTLFELASIKYPDNLPLLSKNTWKFIISSMTVAAGEIKLENNLDLFQHASREKT